METKNNNNNAEYELGPIEYSGLTSGGSTIMGVAPLSPTITNITPDPILSWTIPKDMSFEEASTIPVPYSMVNSLARASINNDNNEPLFKSTFRIFIPVTGVLYIERN